MNQLVAGKRAFQGDNDNDNDASDNDNNKQERQPHVKKPRNDEKRAFKLRPLRGNPVQTRRTVDEVHTSVDMSPVVTALTDTPQFQRLRRIRQLGTAEYVYNNCTHTRFEHSLGVAYLARKMCQRVRIRQPQLPVTERDALCVQLAGLLHDIGHGPYSHTYEGFVHQQQHHRQEEEPLIPPSAHSNTYDDDERKSQRHHEAFCYEDLPRVDLETWRHEEVSLRMMDAALAHLGLAVDLDHLDAPLRQIGDGVDATTFRVFRYGLTDDDAVLTSRDWVFIKECVYGGPIGPVYDDHPAVRTLVGRGLEKEWMYDIVSNGHSGLDVDKMDYFARDQRRAFGTSGDVFTQMIEDCYVAWGKCSTRPEKCAKCRAAPDPQQQQPRQHLMIVYGEKIEKSAINFFKERLNLHEKIYRHKTVQAATYMVQDIFSLADPYMPLSTKPKFGSSDDSDSNKTNWGQPKSKHEALPMSLAVLDIRAFERLNDSIIDLIEAREDVPELLPAQEVIRRLRCRDLYKCMGVLPISLNDPHDAALWNLSTQQIKDDLLSIPGEHDDGTGTPVVLRAEDFIVEKCNIHHGLKAANPLTNMRFIQKRDEFALNRPWDSLPVAVEYNAKKLEANLPTTFESNSIRVFCRTKSKEDLLEHIFISWVKNRDMIMTAGPPEQCELSEPQAPVALSQEDGDMDYGDDGSEYGYMNHHPPGDGGNHPNDDDDDDASVDLNRGVEDHDPQPEAAGDVPSPSALVSPDRARLKRRQG